MSVHLYRAPLQPATKFEVLECDPPCTLTHAARHPLRTNCCRERRWAQYVEAQVFYDEIRYWCAAGHGCKGAKHGR